MVLSKLCFLGYDFTPQVNVFSDIAALQWGTTNLTFDEPTALILEIASQNTTHSFDAMCVFKSGSCTSPVLHSSTSYVITVRFTYEPANFGIRMETSDVYTLGFTTANRGKWFYKTYLLDGNQIKYQNHLYSANTWAIGVFIFPNKDSFYFF